MKHCFFLLVSSLFFSTVLASEFSEQEQFFIDRKCVSKWVTFNDNYVSLDVGTNKQRLFLIKNIHEAPIWLDHPSVDPGASAGWASLLNPQHWSAIVINQPKFVLSCVESKPGSEQYIACNKHLFVCAINKGKLVENLQTGGFWQVENLTFNRLLDALERRAEHSTSMKSK